MHRSTSSLFLIYSRYDSDTAPPEDVYAINWLVDLQLLQLRELQLSEFERSRLKLLKFRFDNCSPSRKKLLGYCLMYELNMILSQ